MTSLNSIRYSLIPQMKAYDVIGHEWKPYLMFLQKSNFKSQFVNTDSFGLRYSTSRDNTNIPYTLIDKPSSKLLDEFAIVGGSTAFGVGASSDNDTIASHLSQMNKVNVYNLGGRAFSGFQSLILFQILASRLSNLKYLIIMSSINDIFLPHYVKLRDNNLAPFYYQNNFYEQLNQPTTSTLKKILHNILPSEKKQEIDWLWDDKYEILKKIFNLNKKKQTESNANVQTFNYKKSTADTLKIWKMFSESMNFKVIYAFDVIQKLCDHELSDEERKIFGMLKKTYSKKINDVITQLSMDRYDEYKNFVKEECLKNDFMYFDTNKVIGDPKYNKKWLFVDSIHYTDLGYKIIAEALNILIK